MARTLCPNHPDCFIDCDGSGYAVYEPPFGPCLTGCDQAQVAAALEDRFRDRADVRLSAALVGVMVGTLADFASRMAAVASPGASSDINDLQRAAILEPERRVNASFTDADLIEVLQILAEVVNDGKESGSAAAAA